MCVCGWCSWCVCVRDHVVVCIPYVILAVDRTFVVGVVCVRLVWFVGGHGVVIVWCCFLGWLCVIDGLSERVRACVWPCVWPCVVCVGAALMMVCVAGCVWWCGWVVCIVAA